MIQTKQRVVVAMSGGVDSSVAAALLKSQGYEVVGMMLRLWSEENTCANRCCTPESVEDARAIADQLEIPFYVLDYKDYFKDQVVDYFINTYQAGLTPNPCLTCNKQVRFGRLLQEALTLGASHLATGHYAQLQQEEGIFHLVKGVDASKDQSYVLYRLDQHQLSHLMFPLGGMHKTRVRELAEEFNLKVAQRPDSQDLCFIGDEDYRGFLRRHRPQAFVPGDMVTKEGKVLGQHQGLPGYTIGQRRGLGVSWSEPLYVIEMDRRSNRLILGTKADTLASSLKAHQMHFLSGQVPDSPLQVTAKIRYTAPEVPATLTLSDQDQGYVEFARPLTDITPGQAVVFYQNDRLLGGGVIQRQIH